jgi:hypothetical protein
MGNCGDCRFYTPFTDKKGWGYCHRYPPSGWKATSFSFSGQFSGRVALKSARAEELSAGYEGKIRGLWEQPLMEPHDWCGEHQPKAETDSLMPAQAGLAPGSLPAATEDSVP